VEQKTLSKPLGSIDKSRYEAGKGGKSRGGAKSISAPSSNLKQR